MLDTPLKEMIPAHRVLREQTRGEHVAAEETSVMHALMNGRLQTDGYARLLKGYFSLYSAWETHHAAWLAQCDDTDAWHYRIRSPLLREDLRSLHAGGESVTQAVRAYPMMSQASTASEAWGALYVVEGSSLGGQLIVRQLRRVFPQLPHRFFGLAHRDESSSWKAFQRTLDQQLSSAEQISQAVNGARQMFDCFRQMLEGIAL